LTDTGKILGNLLIKQGFASELSLLIHPVIVGKKPTICLAISTRTSALNYGNKELFRKDTYG